MHIYTNRMTRKLLNHEKTLTCSISHSTAACKMAFSSVMFVIAIMIEPYNCFLLTYSFYTIQYWSVIGSFRIFPLFNCLLVWKDKYPYIMEDTWKFFCSKFRWEETFSDTHWHIWLEFFKTFDLVNPSLCPVGAIAKPTWTASNSCAWLNWVVCGRCKPSSRDFLLSCHINFWPSCLHGIWRCVPVDGPISAWTFWR